MVPLWWPSGFHVLLPASMSKLSSAVQPLGTPPASLKSDHLEWGLVAGLAVLLLGPRE